MLAADINSVTIPNRGIPRAGVQCGNTWYFSAITTLHGSELWRSDGTPGGTYMVKDIDDGYPLHAPSSATPPTRRPSPDVTGCHRTSVYAKILLLSSR